MNDTRLTKDALYVPSIIFESGTLSSSGGKVTWNGEELGGSTLDASGNITFTGLDTFTQYVTFDGGMICNSDIVLNGARLLLANGATVEIYQGTDIPLPEGGGDTGSTSPGTDNSGESIDTSNFAKLNEDNTFTGNNNFTGTLKLDNQNIIAEQKPITKSIWANVGGSPVIVYNDNTERGSALYLFGKSNNDFKGGFVLRALATDDTYKDLRGFNDGTLTWNQKNIVTSDYMSDINWDSDISTDPYIGINNKKVSGPYIYFRRGDSTTSAGSLELNARNATSASKTLKLNVDGTLTWCGKNVITNDIPFGFPDYTSVVRMEYNNAEEYIAPDNGWIGVDVNGAFNDDIIMITLSIDGIRVRTIPKGYCDSFIIPIVKNSIFKGVTLSNSGTIEAIGHIDWFLAKK